MYLFICCKGSREKSWLRGLTVSGGARVGRSALKKAKAKSPPADGSVYRPVVLSIATGEVASSFSLSRLQLATFGSLTGVAENQVPALEPVGPVFSFISNKLIGGLLSFVLWSISLVGERLLNVNFGFVSNFLRLLNRTRAPVIWPFVHSIRKPLIHSFFQVKS